MNESRSDDSVGVIRNQVLACRELLARSMQTHLEVAVDDGPLQKWHSRSNPHGLLDAHLQVLQLLEVVLGDVSVRIA